MTYLNISRNTEVIHAQLLLVSPLFFPCFPCRVNVTSPSKQNEKKKKLVKDIEKFTCSYLAL